MAAYIKFDGVDGESKDDGHKGWSDLRSFKQIIRKPGAGTGATRRRGDVILDDLVCTKEYDKSSIKLAETTCTGKVYPKVEIHMTASYTDSNRVTYLAYVLTNVQVVSYNVVGTGGNDGADNVPMEEFTLNFEEIKVTYTENDNAGKKKGNAEYTWKVEEGTK